MKLYRFSPIKDKAELFAALKHVHIECYKLCYQSFGYVLSNAGNISIFCHYDSEHTLLTNIRKELTEPSDNPNQKYFLLHKPLVMSPQNGVPETVYTHLYIRRPDPYRHHVGDIDFYLEPAQYAILKQRLLSGESITGARIFERTDLDMIELFDPDSDVLAYVSTKKMSQAVRVKQSEATKL